MTTSPEHDRNGRHKQNSQKVEKKIFEELVLKLFKC